MNAWRMPVISAIVAGGVLLVVIGVLAVVRSTSTRFSEKYLANKTDDIQIENFHEHFVRHYPNESPETEQRIRKEISKYADGTLFHFNFPESDWKAHGGEKGYAIAKGRYVVWRRILARS